jgi:hypothetical protein
MLRKAKNFCQRDRVGYVYIRRGRLPPGAHFEMPLALAAAVAPHGA